MLELAELTSLALNWLGDLGLCKKVVDTVLKVDFAIRAVLRMAYPNENRCWQTKQGSQF
jgi:hypothetical protein